MTFISVFGARRGLLLVKLTSCFALLLVGIALFRFIYYTGTNNISVVYRRLTVKGVAVSLPMPAASRGGWDAEANAPKHRFVDRGGLRAKLLCGLSRACGPDEMAVRVVSGPDTDSASVCVNGDEAIKSSKSRRGMNVVVVHGASQKIVESMSFDTYSHDGTELAEFLGGINDGRIVIMATADDAAFRLGDQARAAIRALGSAKIDSLNFRGSWVFVGQKGMKGTTVYEEVDPAELGLWSNGVEFAGCVPIKGNGF